MNHQPIESFPESPPPEPAAPADQQKPRIWLPALLFLITVCTTVTEGFLLDSQFYRRSQFELLSNPLLILRGLPYSFTILGILLAHELGHFLACRYYGLRCTYPYVIPAPPLPFLIGFGTFGAVIRIKSSFLNRRQLFDVGIAGPIAGFAFLLPALAVGLRLSKTFIPEGSYAEFGEPLLLKLFARAFFPYEDLSSIELHPIGTAAWFGMLATSLNLLPIGQLDGGHIVYAAGGPKLHRIVSLAAFGGLMGLSILSWPLMGYLLFGLLVFFLGFSHPRPLVEFGGIGAVRIVLLAAALLIFALTFVPFLVRFVGLEA